MSIVFPAATALYGALFGLLFLGLSLWVVLGRAKGGVHHGDGGQEMLNRRIRAHANFAEYVPLILLLAALVEAGGAAPRTMHMLLAPLLLARLCHPYGMIAPLESRQQFVFRGLSVIVTWAVLLANCVLLLLRVW
jgi:uncharacterized membrane protein YecN with MAPEG domain